MRKTIFLLLLALFACRTPLTDEQRAEQRRLKVDYTCKIRESRGISTYSECMGRYGFRPATPKPAEWVNPGSPLKGHALYRELSRVKAMCIERSYVGQATRAESSGRYGVGVVGVIGGGGGQAAGNYNSEPTMNPELFNACMGEAGWIEQ